MPGREQKNTQGQGRELRDLSHSHPAQRGDRQRASPELPKNAHPSVRLYAVEPKSGPSRQPKPRGLAREKKAREKKRRAGQGRAGWPGKEEKGREVRHLSGPGTVVHRNRAMYISTIQSTNKKTVSFFPHLRDNPSIINRINSTKKHQKNHKKRSKTAQIHSTPKTLPVTHRPDST